MNSITKDSALKQMQHALRYGVTTAVQLIILFCMFKIYFHHYFVFVFLMINKKMICEALMNGQHSCLVKEVGILILLQKGQREENIQYRAGKMRISYSKCSVCVGGMSWECTKCKVVGTVRFFSWKHFTAMPCFLV